MSILIPALNPSAWTGPTGNNTYLLRGRVPTLVDAGVGRIEHLDAVAAALEGVPLEQVLITHGHPDHVGGVPALSGRWPGARVLAADQIGSSDVIEAGDTRLRAIATPGHAPDHLCFFDEAARDLYCGDLVRVGGTIVIPASRGGNLRQYLDSLRLVRALSPARLLPGHGPIIDNPAGVIDEYLRHRAEREDQVVGALQAGYTTPEAIAARVYKDLAPGLQAAAADSVLAHLVKLQEEQRAILTDRQWHLPRRRPEA
jgi:glyoxylase-like metal-dependent hydrolase (beta-lactamase superfamily II)